MANFIMEQSLVSLINVIGARTLLTLDYSYPRPFVPYI